MFAGYFHGVYTVTHLPTSGLSVECCARYFLDCRNSPCMPMALFSQLFYLWSQLMDRSLITSIKAILVIFLKQGLVLEVLFKYEVLAWWHQCPKVLERTSHIQLPSGMSRRWKKHRSEWSCIRFARLSKWDKELWPASRWFEISVQNFPRLLVSNYAIPGLELTALRLAVGLPRLIQKETEKPIQGIFLWMAYAIVKQYIKNELSIL